MPLVSLRDLARTIRSKNAGQHFITVEVIFDDEETYRKVKALRPLSREKVAQLYGLPLERVINFVEYDPGRALKFTLRRPRTSGDVGETDVYGSQQYIPVLSVMVPWEGPVRDDGTGS